MKPSEQGRTLVVGVGNPIRGDDGAGIRVVRELEDELQRAKVDFVEVAAGGMPLAEQFRGYEHVLMIDALLGIDKGQVLEVNPEELTAEEGAYSVHSLDFKTSLGLLRSTYPGELPELKDIVIIGIGIDPDPNFSEELSSPVREAVEEAKELAVEKLAELGRGEKGGKEG